MPSCVIKHCKSCSQKQKKGDGISFHRFPTDPILRGEWITIIRQSRQNKKWLPSKFCVVCSLHFQEDDVYFTEKGRRLIRKTSKPTKNVCALPPEKSNIDESSMSETASQDQDSPSNTLEVSPLEKSIRKTSKPIKNVCVLPPEKSNIDENLMSKTALQDQDSPSNSLEVSPLEKSIGDHSEESEIIDSDLDSLFDSSRNYQLRKQLRKHKLLRVTNKRKLKTLQQKNRRLQKRNDSLQKMLKELKDKYQQLSIKWSDAKRKLEQNKGR